MDEQPIELQVIQQRLMREIAQGVNLEVELAKARQEIESLEQEIERLTSGIPTEE